MTIRQINACLLLSEKRIWNDLKNMALAVRLGGADEEGFKKVMNKDMTESRWPTKS